MTQIDLKKLEVAMKYVERMADGKNPVKNVMVEDDSVLNDPNVIRCMYFVKEVLTAVRDNDGIIAGKPSKQPKKPFPFECLADFRYIEDTSISHVIKQINELAQDPQVAAIGIKPVTGWLRQRGYLTDVLDKYTGKMRTEVTESGIELGLYMVDRTSMRGQEYKSIVYSRKAQEFIAVNLEKIVNNEL